MRIARVLAFKSQLSVAVGGSPKSQFRPQSISCSTTEIRGTSRLSFDSDTASKKPSESLTSAKITEIILATGCAHRHELDLFTDSWNLIMFWYVVALRYGSRSYSRCHIGLLFEALIRSIQPMIDCAFDHERASSITIIVCRIFAITSFVGKR